ncbi:MAG: VTT domain-containing protein [Flexilinea sp.]
MLFTVLFTRKIDYSSIQNFARNHQVLGIILILVVYAGLGATPVPSEPVTIFLTGLYGPIWTIIFVTVGNTLAAFVEYFIGGQIGDIADFEKKKESMPFHLDRLPVESPIFQVFGRVVPGIGAKFVGITSGVYHVKIFTFLWAAILSNLLGAAIVSYGGYGLLKLI